MASKVDPWHREAIRSEVMASRLGDPGDGGERGLIGKGLFGLQAPSSGGATALAAFSLCYVAGVGGTTGLVIDC